MDENKVSPRDAADLIRDDYATHGAEPGYLHRVKFAEHVCGELGQPANPENIAKAMHLMERHGIDGTAYEAFPGWFDNDLGERAMVQDEDERDAFLAREREEDGTVAPWHGTINAHGKFIPSNMPKPVQEPDEPEASTEY